MKSTKKKKIVYFFILGVKCLSEDGAAVVRRLSADASEKSDVTSESMPPQASNTPGKKICKSSTDLRGPIIMLRPFVWSSHSHKTPLQMRASSLFYLMHLMYHYHQLFIDIERENIFRFFSQN